MSEDDLRQALYQLPDAIKNWILSIGRLEEVKSLEWENEILPDKPDGQWANWKVGKHRRIHVQFGRTGYAQVFVKNGDVYEKASPDAVYSFSRDTQHIPPQQFDHIIDALVNMINAGYDSREHLRQFLLNFAEHVAANIAPVDLTSKRMREIAESIPDMEME